MPQTLAKWHVANYVDYVHQRFMPFIDNYDIEDVDKILRLYSVNTSTTPELCVTSLVSDMRATCPLDEMMRVAANISQSAIYRFQVQTHTPVYWPFVQNYPGKGGSVAEWLGYWTQASWSALPCIPAGSINQVPALAGVRAGMSPFLLGGS